MMPVFRFFDGERKRWRDGLQKKVEGEMSVEMEVSVEVTVNWRKKSGAWDVCGSGVEGGLEKKMEVERSVEIEVETDDWRMVELSRKYEMSGDAGGEKRRQLGS